MISAVSGAARDERSLVRALQAGDERAFAGLVDAHSSWMVRVALMHGVTRAVAEEVVQDAWLSALRSINGFEGRSTLRTWLFAIVTNAARKQAGREARSVSFSAAVRERDGAEEDPLADRFFDDDHPRWAGCWTSAVPGWDRMPEAQAAAHETREVIERAAEALPPAQRAVFTLRDLEGWSSEEVCNALDLSGSNQRVLLHRARLKIRNALERVFERSELP